MTDDTAAEGSKSVSRLNTSVPHSARVWNYLLGGKDNFAADREAADYAVKLMPELVLSARANRQFLGRAVRSWSARAGSVSSWTSAPGCPLPTTPTR
jgi:hypothetical protein